jgi:predicted RNase H-like HicB family nuclease
LAHEGGFAAALPAPAKRSDSRGRQTVGLRYAWGMATSVDFTIAFEEPDEKGWIVARVLEVPGALSQGRTREEARVNVLDALRTVLTPDEELAGQQAEADIEHLHFVAA